MLVRMNEMSLENIKWFTENDGNISIGRFGPCKCAAVASDDQAMLVALAKKQNESFEDLLARLDRALEKALEEDIYTDEIN